MSAWGYVDLQYFWQRWMLLGQEMGVEVGESPTLVKNYGIYPSEHVYGPEEATDLGTGGSFSVLVSLLKTNHRKRVYFLLYMMYGPYTRTNEGRHLLMNAQKLKSCHSRMHAYIPHLQICWFLKGKILKPPNSKEQIKQQINVCVHCTWSRMTFL